MLSSAFSKKIDTPKPDVKSRQLPPKEEESKDASSLSKSFVEPLHVRLNKAVLSKRESKSILAKHIKTVPRPVFQPDCRELPDGFLGVDGSSSASVARSLFDPNVIYRFRIANVGHLAFTGGGVLATYVSWDCSGWSASDWTALESLFDLCLLDEARITVVGVSPQAGSVAYPACVIGACAGVTSAAFSSDSVAALPNAKICATSWAAGKSVTVTSGKRPNMVWAFLTSPSGTVDAGTYGCFPVTVASGTGPASDDAFHYMQENLILLRVRA